MTTVAVGLLTATSAQAALIRLTPQGLTPSQYEALGYPTDPAIIPGDGFRLTYHGGGELELVNPVLLILAVPDDSLVAPTLTSVAGGFDSVGIELGDITGTRYGGSWDPDTGFAGTFDSTTNPKVYNFIGFTPKGSDSENYANWSGATGLASWNLFVYALTFDPRMSRGDFAEFDTNLPQGSYVIGYGCTAIGADGLCTNSGATESTPFTFAGLVRVPEPATVLLFAPAAAFVLRRSRKR